MTDSFYAALVAALILLSFGWASKLYAEGCEAMDILGLAASILGLGFMAGVAL